MTAGERTNPFQRGFITPAGQWRKFFAKFEIFNGDGQPPGRRATPEKLLRERQQRTRVRGVRHELRAIGRFESAHLDFGGSVRGGVHENHGARLGNRFREFGRELMSHESDHAGQGQFGDHGGHLRPHAVIAAQRVAVADDQKIGAGSLTGFIAHTAKLKHSLKKPAGKLRAYNFS